MKKIISIALTAALTASIITVPTYAAESAKETISYNYSYDAGSGYSDETEYTRQMEKLDRGLVAINTSNGVYLSWRLWDSEDARYGSAEKNVSFNVYRGSEKIATVTDSTNYVDKSGNTSSTYSVAPVINEVEGNKCEEVTVYGNNYFDIPIDKPASVTLADGQTYSYSANDASCGDLDGDGDYEIILKWDCNGQDNSNGGYTGNVLLDAYDLNGTKLWRIDLGQNIRAGAHYTQFLVYDFDGDGKSEIACKTAPGSKDSNGEYVTKASHIEEIASVTDEINETSYVNDGGRILDGAEYYTVFDEDGSAIDTIDYPFPRGNVGSWGNNETYGNRVDRFLGAVAYLDGVNPYMISVRGYYAKTTVAAMRLIDGQLSVEHTFTTDVAGTKYEGQGNHNITVADIDNDGKDELITGAICWDDDLSLKWCSGRGHGDALHIGDYDPTHYGLEYFSVHESGGYTISGSTTSSQGLTADYGMTVYDAETGEELYHQGNSKDTGRGAMANIGSGGYYQISGSANMKAEGNGVFSSVSAGPGSNFRIFWDGDLYDEILDGSTNSKGEGPVYISNYNNQTNRLETAVTFSEYSVNGTKNNPSLSADLFGDWREEVVTSANDESYLRIYSTTDETKYKIKTLMHDPVYRSGVAAEQTAYNQPPHPGIYMGSEVFAAEVESIEITKQPTKKTYAQGEELDTNGLAIKATYVDGTSENVTAFTTSGYDPEVVGEQTVTVSYLGKTTTFTVEVKALEKIEVETPPTKTIYTPGQSIVTDGLKVKAYFEGGIEKYLTDTDYTLSGHKPFATGEQTITVTYKDKTAEFKISIKKITGVRVVPPSKTTYYQGQSLDTSDMVVYAVYDDGSKAVTKDYILSGYKSTTLGEQTITISLSGNTATFTVKVVPASIASLNNTYSTTSTESITTDIPIGNYNGSFTIEHKVKVNSIPANGNGNKSSNAGFFVRFMADGQTGGGWYFTKKSDTELNITWKNTRTTSIGTIKLGEEYTFKYNFAEVGTGNGASATLTIIDSNGKQVASVSGLNIRNFSDTPTGRLSPITTLQVNNQANANSTSSVTFDDAIVYSNSKIVSVDGSKITLNLTSLTEKLYAAKYENGTLTNVEIIEPTEIGTNKVVTSSFEPDKVFLWSNVYPVDMWTKAE